MPYFHVVFTAPAAVAALAYQNKAVVYTILFKAASETLRTIAAEPANRFAWHWSAPRPNPKHLGANIGLIAVLHTPDQVRGRLWGQALQHHPHVHCVVPGGGPSADGTRWVGCRPGFFLPVKVLSRLYRRRFLTLLQDAFDARRLGFFSELAELAAPESFAAWLRPLHRMPWVVYAKPPFGGPEQVLGYLGRYTHRVAIANTRLVAMDANRVSFRWKDYRRGERSKRMTLDAAEFIRRFLLHVLPDGFHRIRHYGYLANGHRAARLARCRALLGALAPPQQAPAADRRERIRQLTGRAIDVCPCCGGHMVEIGCIPRPFARRPAAARPAPTVWDTS